MDIEETSRQAMAQVSGREEALLATLLATRNALVLVPGKPSPHRARALTEADAMLEGYPPFEEAKAEGERIKAEAIAKGYWSGD